MQFFQDVQTLFLTFLSFPSSIFCSFAGCWSYSISMEIWVKKIASPAIRGLRWPQSIQSKFVFLFFGFPPPILIAHHDYFWELICLVGLKCFCINITQKCRKTRVHTLLWLMSLILALDMHQPHTPPKPTLRFMSSWSVYNGFRKYSDHFACFTLLCCGFEFE